MWYKVNHNKLTVLLLPIELRQPTIIAYLNLFGQALQSISDNFNQERNRNLYKIEHTAQVCYMEGALNDRFDPELRRIYIADRYENEAPVIYTEAENIHKEIYTIDEVEDGAETLVLHPLSDVAGTSADFKVIVPGLQFNEIEMRALIDYYKLAGKSYTIELK